MGAYVTQTEAFDLAARRLAERGQSDVIALSRFLRRDPTLSTLWAAGGLNVGTAALANDSVTAAKIAADAVGSSEIAGGAVGASELGATAGTTTANIALVPDTNKRLDVLTLGTLSLGAGAGTAVTSDAGELNLLDGSVAGTSVASKALVLDASKRTDVLTTTGALTAGGTLTASAALAHAGTTLGFYNAAPAARPAAYTQTYATATRTHANQAQTDLTHAVGTADGTVDDVGAAFNQTTLNDNFKELTAQIAAIKADMLNVKQVVNSVLDDGQTVGLLQ